MLLVPWPFFTFFFFFLICRSLAVLEKNARVDKEWSGWRSRREEHREDWEAAANERSGAISHAHRTSVRWRQSSGRSLLCDGCAGGLSRPGWPRSCTSTVWLCSGVGAGLARWRLFRIESSFCPGKSHFYCNSDSSLFLELNILIAASLSNSTLWPQQVLASGYFRFRFLNASFFAAPGRSQVSVIFRTVWKSIIRLTVVTRSTTVDAVYTLS